MGCKRDLALLTTSLLALASIAEAEDTKSDNADLQRQFISCPVYRDTDAGPKSGCWLATNRESGEVFDVSGALSKPLAEKAILVEGVVSERDPGQCGAPVLEPVRVSVLEDECAKHIIPAEGFPGKRFDLPAEVMQPLSVPRQLPEPPYSKQTYTILFGFNSSFLNYQYSEIILEKAALYIKASRPQSVQVTGFAATDPYVVSDRDLEESLALAESRAKQVALALERLAGDAARLTVNWKGSPAPTDHYAGGLPEETKRRVEITIVVQ